MKQLIILMVIIVCATTMIMAQTPNRRNNANRRVRLSQINFVEKCYYKTNAAKLNLKGKVKSIKETQYKATKKGDIYIKEPDNEYYSTNVITTFSETGDEILSTSINKDGMVTDSREYKYIKPGMESQWLNYNGKHELESKVTFEYDDKDYLITKTVFDTAGKIKSKSRSNYNFTSNSTYEKQFVKDDGTLDDDKYIYTYNTDTLLADEESISPNSAFSTYRIMYSYDSTKRLAEKTLHNSIAKDGEDTRTAGFKTVSITKYEYDAKGNMIKESSELIDFAGQSGMVTETYEYVYDTKGNWTKKITHRVELGNYIIAEREIKYY